MRIRGQWVRGLGLLLLLAACGRATVTPEATQSPTPGPVGATVTALVFSGRPDPSWTLAPEQAQEFLAWVEALPGGPAQAEPTGLGSRGYAVTVAWGGGQKERVFRVYEGTVREDTFPNQPGWRRDATRGLEAWLLGTGKAVLDPELMAFMEQTLPPQGDFALFRVSGEEASGAPILDAVPLLAVQDLVSYEQATHTLTLNPEAYARLAKLEVPLRGVRFAVCVGSEVIYTGAFWSMLSSASFDGVVINAPLLPDSSTIQLVLGYPGEPAFQGEDPRSDPRIIQALARAGVLK